MRKLLAATAILASAFGAGYAQAADPTLTDVTCADLASKYDLTEEAKVRFEQLRGSCQGVYELNGARYVLVNAVYRGRKDGKYQIYLPATDRTVAVPPTEEHRVLIGGKKFRPSELNRGDEINIYLSVDKFATEKVVEEVHFATEDTSTETIVAAPVEEEPTPALPTTASPLPLVAVLSLCLLGLAAFFRRSTGKA